MLQPLVKSLSANGFALIVVQAGLVIQGPGHSVARDRIELSTSRFSGGRSYRLSYLAVRVTAVRVTAVHLTGS